MKIFYTGLGRNYHAPKHELTFEHDNFYRSLRRMRGFDVTYFSFNRILEVGKYRFNRELLEAVKRDRPDAVFVFMVADELEREILEELKQYTTTIAWFADDSWRFHNYSRRWAHYFSWVVTTYSWMPDLYRKIGQPNVIRSQWAADTLHYHPPEESLRGVGGPPVCFIGGWNRPRERIVNALERAGIEVAVYGGGWPRRRVSNEEMVRLFGTSKINLGLNPAPGYFNVNSLGRLFFRRSIDTYVPDFHLVQNVQSWLHRGISQIKARHFEIPSCGGFLITSMADDFNTYYEIGKEIVVYESIGDLVEKIRYYLAHEDERRKIAHAGYLRTVREHTYERRFTEIFRRIGLLR